MVRVASAWWDGGDVNGSCWALGKGSVGTPGAGKFCKAPVPPPGRRGPLSWLAVLHAEGQCCALPGLAESGPLQGPGEGTNCGELGGGQRGAGWLGGGLQGQGRGSVRAVLEPLVLDWVTQLLRQLGEPSRSEHPGRMGFWGGCGVGHRMCLSRSQEQKC